ncbi:hypothetical protein CEXT_766191 [Caerostris extrusa]|uniref:Uncharacterized protein n=1 Tax=Caerostris extrusa TaxID=172846 RepID=A0AAV4WA07_CAEEX|nr:hypothetical protein CEXT_766191 [Caerostris extrusa]
MTIYVDEKYTNTPDSIVIIYQYPEVIKKVPGNDRLHNSRVNSPTINIATYMLFKSCGNMREFQNTIELAITHQNSSHGKDLETFILCQLSTNCKLPWQLELDNSDQVSPIFTSGNFCWVFRIISFAIGQGFSDM